MARIGGQTTDLKVRNLLLMALTVSSGAVDAISFLGLGKVFTAFMTGNFVLLGLTTAGASGPSVVSAAVALVVFAAGAFLGGRIAKPSKGTGAWSRRATIALGITGGVQACFLAVWVAAAGLPTSGVAEVLIGLSALAMGMQTATVFLLGLRGVFTTAATATLTVFMTDLAAWSQSAATERWLLAGTIVSLFVGATVGSLLMVHARTFAPVFPLAISILVVATAAIALRGRD